MKNIFKRLAMGIMCTIVSISAILPIQVAAALATGDDAQIIENNPSNTPSANSSTDKILYEVEEKRDEFSKTYLLADGSYYTCISPVALHTYDNGNWINNDETLNSPVVTKEDVETNVSAFNLDMQQNIANTRMRTSNSELNLNITYIGGASSSNDSYLLPYDGALAIKPASIDKLSMYNKVLLSASLHISIESNSNNDYATLTLKELDEPVTSSTSFNSVLSKKDIYCKNYESEKTEYTFDITDIYSKWERSRLDNNGIAFICDNIDPAEPMKITALPIMSIVYKAVNDNDASFTYHTLDLGRAGILSINDVTNAFKLEQTIAGLDCSLLPVTLTKTIDSSKFTLASYANASSEWNYNYSLSIANTYATLRLPQGTMLNFEQPNNAITSNGYQSWVQITNQDYVDNAVLYVSETTLITGNVNNCYVDINGIEYWFNSLGKIKYIEKGNKRLNVSYEYIDALEQVVITKLTDAVGNQYCISYSTYSVNNNSYVYANKVEVKDADNNAIMYGDTPLVINISNTIEDSMIQSMFSYPIDNNQSVTVGYGYDFNGKLLGIQSADGTITELHYKNADNTYLTGYTQRKNNEVINEFTISSTNTYERIFDGKFTQQETQRYDTNFNLVTYYYGNNAIGLTYNDGVVNSYAINQFDSEGNSIFNESENKLINGDFSNGNSIYPWTRLSYVTPKVENGKVIITNDNIGTKVGIKQSVQSNNLSVDKTYVFSADATITTCVPSDDGYFVAKIELQSENGETLDVFELPFDTTLINKNQTRMCTFKIDVPFKAQVNIYAVNNAGTILVDNVRLYEATPEDGSYDIPTVLTDDRIISTHTEDGMIKSEMITDSSTYMLQEYEYSGDDSKLISTVDFNGLPTYFDYSGRTGRLSQKGYSLNGDYIADPICYDYSGDLLSEVSQIVNTVTNIQQEHLLRYAYDNADRITSVTNNGYSYLFEYDNLGNITTIDKKSTEANATSNNLVNYTYTNNNVDSIVYSNGYKIEYTRDTETDKITQITCLKQDSSNEYIVIGSYSYEYANGSISKTIIENIDLDYDIEIAYTSTGIETYHIVDGVSILVYSKSKSASNTVENYLCSDGENSTYETFTQTIVTETENGNNTEYYSAFSGSKLSALNPTSTRLQYSGSNNIIKDYYGRTSSKYFTLESDLIDPSTNDSEQYDELSLTYNYQYLSGEDFEEIYPNNTTSGTRTSNLIDSMTSIVYSESTVGTQTTTENLEIGFKYVYDDNGNIRFQYLCPADDLYYIENLYQYDEANQIEASISEDGIVFYVYDDNGNIIEKQIGGENSTTGGNFDDIAEIAADSWDKIVWDNYLNITLTPLKPEKKILYTYDNLGRLSNYKEQSFTYTADGNVATQSTIVDIPITYDDYGNPLKYIGENTLEGTITADLSWNGALLQSAIIYKNSNIHQKLTFGYDENGYRINKTIYDYNSSSSTYSIDQQIGYVWDNGTLKGMNLMLVDNASSTYTYTNILYDNTGVPYGITTPIGFTYYFLRDAMDNIRGLVSPYGEVINLMSYDAFGNLSMEINGGSLGSAIINTLATLYNPCSYKGYLYDHELGMYFTQNKCYSPKFGRYLNETSLDALTDTKASPLDINLNLICNNNPVNNSETSAEWNKDKFVFTSDNTYGIQVEMSKAFLSRPFCSLYASKIIRDSGSWDYLHGRSLNNMGIERIASNLFARCVGNYAESAINRVNATWGDGWIVSNRNSNIILITESDPNADKYLKIWSAAPSIKNFAVSNGIYIIL